MKKRKAAIIMALLASMLVCACSAGSFSDTGGNREDSQKRLAKEKLESQKQKEVFQVEGYDIRIETPAGWEETDAVNFDLQCLSPKSDMYLSVYGFYRIDMSEDQTVEELFEIQNSMILDNREHVKEINPISFEEDEYRAVYSVLYSGERDGHKNYYQMYMIEFYDSDKLAWILFTGVPSVIEHNREAIDSIISNVTVLEPEEV